MTGLHQYHVSTSSNVSERHAGGMPPSEHADWVLDLGPGGGVNGGEIVAEGTPEDVAANARSFTGAYLKETLAGSPRAPAQAGAQSKSRSSSRAKWRRSEGQPNLIAVK
jgi:excinuclease ABC subunit A